MDSIFDLLGAHPRVALSASHLLNGEVTTPYGQDPSLDAVETAWRDAAGNTPAPPWLLLGPRDTPNGTVWRLSWCPPRSDMPGSSEIVLPRAAWVLERLSEEAGPEGWHLRVLASPFGTWVGLWEGSRCDRLHGPYANEHEGIARVQAIAAKSGIEPSGEVRGSWTTPTTRALRELAAARPESDLLGPTESVRRNESRADRVAGARVLAMLALFGLVTVGFGLVQGIAWKLRDSQETRLESVRPLLDRVAILRESRQRLGDSVRVLRDALAPNSSADRILSGIARVVPDGASLQALALERSGEGWRVRTEARLCTWNQVQPFAQSLRSVPGVAKVAVASQPRSGDGVLAVLELEGTWP